MQFEKGYCDICGKETLYQIGGKFLRDDYICTQCHSIPRQRALIHVLRQICPDFLEKAQIHESSPGGPSSDFLFYHAKHFSFSHFYPDIPSGNMGPDGAICEDLEQLSFLQDSFDIFITQDVLEHLFNIESAFREIARVLKPGGFHIFTVPYYPNISRSVCRATKERNGFLTFLKEKIYHGNPVDKNGSLVTWDYGLDLPEIIFRSSGLFTEIYNIKDRSIGIDGTLQEVFVSRKLASNNNRQATLACVKSAFLGKK